MAKKKVTKKTAAKTCDTGSCGCSNICYCKAILSILAIIFVWIGWTSVAVTLLGVVTLLLALGICCCHGKK